MKYKNRSFVNAPSQLTGRSPKRSLHRWSCSNILYTIKTQWPSPIFIHNNPWFIINNIYWCFLPMFAKSFRYSCPSLKPNIRHAVTHHTRSRSADPGTCSSVNRPAGFVSSAPWKRGPLGSSDITLVGYHGSRWWTTESWRLPNWRRIGVYHNLSRGTMASIRCSARSKECRGKENLR